MSAVLFCGTPMMFSSKCAPLGALLPVNAARPSGESRSEPTEVVLSEQPSAPTIKIAPAKRAPDAQPARTFPFKSIVNSFGPWAGHDVVGEGGRRRRRRFCPRPFVGANACFVGTLRL